MRLVTILSFYEYLLKTQKEEAFHPRIHEKDVRFVRTDRRKTGGGGWGSSLSNVMWRGPQSLPGPGVRD